MTTPTTTNPQGVPNIIRIAEPQPLQKKEHPPRLRANIVDALGKGKTWLGERGGGAGAQHEFRRIGGSCDWELRPSWSGIATVLILPVLFVLLGHHCGLVLVLVHGLAL